MMACRGVRAWLAIKEKAQKYQAHLNALFIVHNLNNNSGVISQMLNEAQEQVRAVRVFKNARDGNTQACVCVCESVCVNVRVFGREGDWAGLFLGWDGTHLYILRTPTAPIHPPPPLPPPTNPHYPTPNPPRRRTTRPCSPTSSCGWARRRRSRCARRSWTARWRPSCRWGRREGWGARGGVLKSTRKTLRVWGGVCVCVRGGSLFQFQRGQDSRWQGQGRFGRREGIQLRVRNSVSIVLVMQQGISPRCLPIDDTNAHPGTLQSPHLPTTTNRPSWTRRAARCAWTLR